MQSSSMGMIKLRIFEILLLSLQQLKLDISSAHFMCVESSLNAHSDNRQRQGEIVRQEI